MLSVLNFILLIKTLSVVVNHFVFYAFLSIALIGQLLNITPLEPELVMSIFAYDPFGTETTLLLYAVSVPNGS